MNVPTGDGMCAAVSEAVSEHPVEGFTTNSTNESVEHIREDAFSVLEFEMVCPPVLTQLYAIPGVLVDPSRFTVVHPQKAFAGDAAAFGFGFTVTVKVIF